MQNPMEWHARGQMIKINEFDLFVIDENKDADDVVLLVHGFPTSSFDWQAVWPAIKSGYRVIAMDMLGFGFSDKPDPHLYSIHEQAELIDGLCNHLQIRSAHILAHDYGDTVTQELLARHNGHDLTFNIRSVCFLNGGLFPETHQALLIQKLLLSPLGPLINRLTNKSRFDQSFSSVFGPDTQPSPEELQQFWDIINYNNGRHIFHNLITYMRDRRSHRQRWIDSINDAEIPIALINGSVDPVSGAHMVARFIELCGEPDFLKELSDIGHYPQVEAPKTVAENYLNFIGNTKRQP